MATIYVKYNAIGSNNGSSWTNAYTSLQSGITAAVSGTSDQIWVSAGTYYPTIQVGGTGSTNNSFTMKSGIAIYGGFNGTETGLTQRNYITNVVILNGAGCYHVFNNTDLTLTSATILDGFTISGGTASGVTGSTYNFGGGILNYTTTAVKTNTSIIRNCRFTSNFSNDSGGAIYNSRYHSPNIYNCSFDNNTTYYLGGAIFSQNNNTIVMKCNFYNNKKISSLGNGGGAIAILSSYNIYVNNISNCNFYNNIANDIIINGGFGGALYIYDDPGITTIANCFFSGNTAEYGGAIYTRAGSALNGDSSTITIKNCIVSGNTATYGAGIFNDTQNTIINNTKIIGNSASQQAGGVYNRYGRPILNSCLITGNKAINYAGGIYCNAVPSGSTISQVNNCTISGNYAARGGAIALITTSKYYIRNSILSGNVANVFGNNLFLDASGCSMNLDHCQYTTNTNDNYIFTGATFIVTNSTTSDPVFVDPIIPTSENAPNTLGDYRIKGTSPCVNAGLNTNISLSIDVRGQQRKIGNLQYNIRDAGPAGGLIFYINTNYLVDGWRYLEAEPAPISGDTVNIRFSNVNNLIGTTLNIAGSGSGNTANILSQSGYIGDSAALECSILNINGYSDWYCPSKDELNYMYTNLFLYGVGNFSLSGYWSSSENDAENAYRQSFNTGFQSSSSKATTFKFRACRKIYSSVINT